MKSKTQKHDIKTRKAIAEVGELCRHIGKHLNDDTIEEPGLLLAELTKKTKGLLNRLGYNHPKAVDMVYCLRDGRIVRDVGKDGFEDSCEASNGFRNACLIAGGRVRGGCIG
ncbi:MAG TPA: hypothetical protein VGC87_03450 [Pyrinomonadaceae bacterium]|jgi:hypothetical protein